MSGEPLLRLEGLSVAYGDGPDVVAGLSLEVRPGECVALVGSSGSGKSSAARAVLGLAGRDARIGAEQLRVDGEDVLGFDERAWNRFRGARVGLVLQDALASLDPLRTIRQEIEEPLAEHDVVPRPERLAEVERLLGLVGLSELSGRLDARPHELSGGQRQRVLIASALAGRPRLLIADEPTTALDVTVRAGILALLASLAADGHGILLLSHDLTAVRGLADRVVVMSEGCAVEEGATADVLDAPRHPVTRALIAAVPDRAREQRDAEPVALSDDAAKAPPILDVDNVSFRYRQRSAASGGIADVSFAVRRGETVGVVGESGSGKSTLASVVAAMTAPDEGTVRLDGGEWSGVPERRRRSRRRRVQWVHQDTLSAFDPRHTVDRVLADALAVAGVPRRDRRAAGRRLLETVDLAPELGGRRPRTLSGGQRQRVAIARALAAQPELLICDEPVSALDLVSQSAVIELLDRLARSMGVAIVFISHDLAVVRLLCDRILVMRSGRVIESGRTEDVWADPHHPYTRTLLDAARTPQRKGPA